MSENNEYEPDNWVVIRLQENETAAPIYKVLAGGDRQVGTRSDTWRFNSGIVGVEDVDHSYNFHGYSGSVYICNKYSYRLEDNISHFYDNVKAQLGDRVTLMDEDTDWLSIDWGVQDKHVSVRKDDTE